jgi:putative membrane protein
MLTPGKGGNLSPRLMYLLLLLYVAARILQPFAGKVPTLLIVVLHVLPPAAFAFLHGRMVYRTRGILVFLAVCLGVGAFFESLGLRTGFPFGSYYFTDLMGPKVFQLPVLLVLAYVGMGYVSWVIGLLILGSPARTLTGRQVVLLPPVASFVMVAWDLAMDPVWTNIDHAWVWRNGGAYFGVPVSNFFGWFLTIYVIYQVFAVYLRNRAFPSLPPEFWRLPVLFYGASAAGNLLLAIPSSTAGTVTTSNWTASGIVGVCVLVSFFVMGPFTLIAWSRLPEGQQH